MDELMISGKRYISTRRAGKEYHYHSDYIGQLIRAGKVAGQKVGRSWYVSEASLAAHLRKEAAESEANKKASKTAKVVLPPEADAEPKDVMAVDEVPHKASDPNTSEHENKTSLNMPAASSSSAKKEPTRSGAILSQNLQDAGASEFKMLKYIPEKEDKAESSRENTIWLNKASSNGQVEKASGSMQIDRDHYIERERERNIKTQELLAKEFPVPKDDPMDDMPVPVRLTTRPQGAERVLPAAPIAMSAGAAPTIPMPPQGSHGPLEYGEEPRGSGRLVAAIVILGLLAFATGLAISMAPVV